MDFRYEHFRQTRKHGHAAELVNGAKYKCTKCRITADLSSPLVEGAGLLTPCKPE